MRIREATLDDLPRVAELSRAFLDSSHYHYWENPTPAKLEDFVLLVFSIGVIYVAELDSSDREWTPDPPAEVVGVIAGLPLPHPLTGEGYVDEVAWWVDPIYRRGRLAHKLLSRLEQYALDIGAKYLRMVAPAGSHIGTLYLRRGYSEIETSWHRRLIPRNGPRGSGAAE